MNVSEVIELYGSAWAEPDEAARRAILEACWADDGLYVDPTARADGREAFVQHIGGFQAVFAGHSIDLTTGVDEHDGYLRFGWVMRDPQGGTVMEGIDLGQLADDGRLSLICGFFGPMPAP